MGIKRLVWVVSCVFLGLLGCRSQSAGEAGVVDMARAEDATPAMAALDAEVERLAVPPRDGQTPKTPMDVGIYRGHGTIFRDVGPIKRVYGDKTGFDSKLNAAMSGGGTALVVGHGQGGMGLRGNGAGGGGQGFGRIHGMGKIDTGGGRGTKARLGGKKKKRKYVADGNGPRRDRRRVIKALAPGPHVRIAGAFKTMRTTPNLKQERADPRKVTGFVPVASQPVSTVSTDADTASYSLSRWSIERGVRPNPASVHIEDFVNRFDYGDPAPTGRVPLKITIDVGAAPWHTAHRLVRVGLKARELTEVQRKPTNLVFLIDVSGSMGGHDRLPLVQHGLQAMVRQLRPDDRVAIVTYAGASGLVLPSTLATDRAAIIGALDRLRSGGSTAGGAGIELAYKVASAHFIKGGNNQVVLATDGDFNVGIRDDAALVKLIEQKRANGVFLTVLGVGRGNLQADKMEKLAQHGNGRFHFLDGVEEAQRVLVRNLTQALVTVAKDVKLQIEFNPAKVKAYRLLGYENRVLATEDFADDKKDAGELNAGHTVSFLYELIPAGSDEKVPAVEPLKYQRTAATGDGELLTVKVRYKQPTGKTSKRVAVPVFDRGGDASQALNFASAVVELALLLRQDPHKGEASFKALVKRAQDAKGKDADGDRAAFIKLAQAAEGAAQPSGHTGGSQRHRKKKVRVRRDTMEGSVHRGAHERHRKKKVRVRRGRGVMSEGCDEKGVMRVISARQRGITYCYEKELSRSPKLLGKVTIKAQISAEGRVAEVEIDASTLKNKTVEGCMLRQIKRWKFAKPTQSCEWTIPFLFSSGL